MLKTMISINIVVLFIVFSSNTVDGIVNPVALIRGLLQCNDIIREFGNVVTGKQSFGAAVKEISGQSRLEENSQKFDEIRRQLSGLQEQQYLMNEKITQAISQLDYKIPMHIKISQLQEKIIKIKKKEKDMEYIKNSETKYEEATLDTFAKDGIGLSLVLEELHTSFFGSKETTTFEDSLLDIITNYDINLPVCAMQKSKQQFIYEMSREVLLTESTAVFIIIYSYSLLRGNKTEAYKQEISDVLADDLKRLNRSEELIEKALMTADRSIWRCDPTVNVENVTYTEMRGMIQGYVQNERYLDITGTCGATCEYYNSTTYDKCIPDEYELCEKQKSCTGKITNCEFVQSDMKICFSEDKSQRYKYIKYSSNEMRGKNESCQYDELDVSSWTNFLAFSHCSVCFCYCERDSNSDSRISLEEIVTDQNENMIVTGLRFVKDNNILHLQIEESKVLINDTVDENTTMWKDIKKSRVRSLEIDSSTRIYLFDTKSNDPDFIVTGLRFYPNEITNSLYLEAQFTKYDPETGALEKGTEFWQEHLPEDTNNTKIELKNPHIPYTTKADKMSLNNTYISFTHSDKITDAAQHTVPFIDIQEVAPSIKEPISGIGLYHKYDGHYYGYLAPKLISFRAG